MPFLCSCLDLNPDREALKQHLPPCFSLKVSGWKPRLVCNTVVRVKHSGLLSRTLEARQKTHLLLVDFPSPVGDSAFRMKSPLPADLFGIHHHFCNDLRNPPIYSPAFLFEGAIDNHACCYPGSLLLLRLWVTIPPGLAQQPSIHLHNITISIRNITVLKPSHYGTVLLSDILNQRIAVNADIDTIQERGCFELDPQLWTGVRIPETLQAAGSHNLFGEHILHITAEFSSERLRTIMVCGKASCSIIHCSIEATESSC